MGDISVFEMKTSFQAKAVAATIAAPSKVSHKSLIISANMNKLQQLFLDIYIF